MTDHFRKAQSYRDHARALRSLAESTGEKVQKDLYAVAAEYEVLAAELERDDTSGVTRKIRSTTSLTDFPLDPLVLHSVCV